MFSTGNFSTFASLKTSVETYLTASGGWSLTSGVLHKGAAFFKLTATTEALLLEGGTGQSGSDLTGAASAGVKIMSFVGSPMGFPADYDLHVFDDPAEEVYLVVNYNGDKYQQLSFGVSNVEQVGGTGAWFTGSFAETASDAGDNLVYLQADAYSIGPGFSGFGLGLFLGYDTASPGSSYIHTGLDTTGWKEMYNNDGSIVSSASIVAGPLQALPSQFNQNTVLLPLLAVQRRLSQGQTIAADLVNARLCRIDNHLASQVVPYGGTDWKVYPWHRKNADVRNGVPWSTGADHTGTFGFAIHYTGP